MNNRLRNITAVLISAAMLILCSCNLSADVSPITTATPAPTEPEEISLSEGAKAGELSHGRKVYVYMGHRVSRLFYYYIPSTYKEGETLPVMISLHGAGANATLHKIESNWIEYAERDKFIVIIPESVYIHADRTIISSEGKSAAETKQSDYSYLRWSVSYIDPCARYRVDDVKYISDLIDMFVEEGYADASRVYVSGMSYGGFLSLRLALEIPDKIAGVGAVAALLCAEFGQYELSKKTKLVFINGTKDEVVPIEGMIYDFNNDGIKEYTWAYSLDDSTAFFLEKYGMRNNPVISALPDTNPDDGTTITRYEYVDEDGTAQIVKFIINGGGHTWPGGNVDFSAKYGPICYDAQAAELIWNELKDTRKTESEAN